MIQLSFVSYVFSSDSSETAPSAESTGAVSPALKQVFNKFAGTDGEIDVYELQDMLTLHFSTG